MRRRASRGGSPQYGLALLECAAALALAGLVLASTANVSVAVASIVRRTRLLADTVDVARNLLEHQLGSPCASTFDCPAGYRCDLTRTVVAAGVDRVTATAASANEEVVEELSTLAASASCGA